MNWYLQNGNDSDVVLSTRIRFARNVKGFKFNLRNKEEIEELENKIKDNLYSIGYGLKFLKLKEIDDITKMSLVEKRVISPNHVLNNNETGSILINDDENICIMVNDGDNLKIQVFSSGLDLENTLNLGIEIDKKIEERLNYSISEKYGYLTACPSDTGTGLRCSVMLFLPGLSKTGNIRNILEVISSFGMNVKGIYGENGDIFQISNKQTLGITENEIIQNLKVITEKIIEEERKARKFLAQDGVDLEDKIYRSYGILYNCRKISLDEALKLLSNIKMGTDLGILDKLTDSKIQKLNLYIKPASMQQYLGNQYEPLERDIKRAEVIKQIIDDNS